MLNYALSHTHTHTQHAAKQAFTNCRASQKGKRAVGRNVGLCSGRDTQRRYNYWKITDGLLTGTQGLVRREVGLVVGVR